MLIVGAGGVDVGVLIPSTWFGFSTVIPWLCRYETMFWSIPSVVASASGVPSVMPFWAIVDVEISI